LEDLWKISGSSLGALRELVAVAGISFLASSVENGIAYILHTRGTIFCWETGVHISAFNKVLLQLKVH
jgi:hypothetical protein